MTSPNVVHVWTIDIAAPPISVETAERLLIPAERERAKRFFFDRDRRRFTIARGALRLLLGQYLQEGPASVVLTYSPHGKPTLEPEAGSTLRFNLSHSRGRVVYAMSDDRELGVDVEQVRPLADTEEIARRFFSIRERAALLSLHGDDRLIGFYRCWTRKEAYLKGLGDGLSRSPAEFDVGVLRDTEPVLLRCSAEGREGSRWTLTDIDVAPGYVGALATEGPPPTIHRRSWEGDSG